jgi:adenylate cyclase
LAGDGMLRLLPVPPREHATRTLSAIDVMDHRADTARLAGAVVIVGGSAAELGGLRPTATDALTPSVQIEADAVQQIFASRFPRVAAPAGPMDLALPGALALIAILVTMRFAPLSSAVLVIGAVLLLWISAITVSMLADRVVDPLTPSIAIAVAFVVASVTSFAATYRREMLIRRRFEQRLAPAIVQRIVEAPELLKLSGERRDVTSLFTDIEGLTAMTHRADPAELVAMLDGYFEGVTAIVVAHGGMVDKIVGDAVHALFNAPLDLKDHSRRAVDCAIAIRDWTERYRAEPAPAALGLGPTRIGIETGPVILGDVGHASRLDYTAYGDAVNAAARLEAANKELGSAICIGPGAAAGCDPAALRPLGSIEVRGRDECLTVYEPWPADAPPEWRQRYLAAFAVIDKDCVAAAALFETLAAERAHDRVARLQAQRVRAAAVGGAI